jgi:hypothetical protein
MKQNIELNKLFEKMWSDYCKMNPQAQSVYDVLTKSGEDVINDHIAFRTFSHPNINIDVLSPHFKKYGYKLVASYIFEEKKLTAQHFEHDDPNYPKVFISELNLALVSDHLNKVVESIVKDIKPGYLNSEDFLFLGRPWQASHSTYLMLAQESEYAAWVYAHGFRPNHFTVYINYLKKLNTIEKLNAFLKENGFPLNKSGGEIKGSAVELLEQSSTMANEIDVQFADGKFKIPSCYYEFAKRYPLPNGKLFQGFIGKSADKIFESTNR